MMPEAKLLLDRSRKSWVEVGPRPISARIWPSPNPGPAPVLLLSHGTGGAGEDLDWLARPLNEAGFLVASADHHGNSYNNEYLVEGFTLAWERPADLSYLLDYIISAYDVDVDRVGSVGFSLGGYTVAALLGARIDERIMGAMFKGHIPAPEVPEFPNMMQALSSSYSKTELTEMAQVGAYSQADPRVRAGVLLAPAMGRLLVAESLQQVKAPVLIRWGEADDNTPPVDNAHVYRDLLPHSKGASVGADDGHYVFLGDREDSSNVRSRVADEVLAFFASHL